MICAGLHADEVERAGVGRIVVEDPLRPQCFSVLDGEAEGAVEAGEVEPNKPTIHASEIASKPKGAVEASSCVRATPR